MRFGVMVAGGVAGVLVGALAYGFMSDRGAGTADPVLAPPSATAFDEEATLAEGPNRGLFSPDGRRVAVLDGAAVSLAERGSLQPFTPSVGRIVDFAWMPDAESVLIAEGPIPTGQVSVVDLEGKVKGTARLNPSIGFGTGHGMSVDSRGARAAVIAVERDAIGGLERTDLAVIDLATGAVTKFPTAETNERLPVFVDDDTVALLEVAPPGGVRRAQRVVLVDLENQARTALDVKDPVSVIGVTNDGEVVVSEGRGTRQVVVAVAVDGSRRVELATLKEGRRAVASDPRALRLLVAADVAVPAPAGGTNTVTRLSAVDIKRPSAGEGESTG